MPTNLSTVDVDEDGELTEEQKRLLLWRDYFELLQQGLIWNNGDDTDEWTERQVETSTWLKVVINELESDVMHRECGQEKFCRWDDPKDLQRISNNIEI